MWGFHFFCITVLIKGVKERFIKAPFAADELIRQETIACAETGILMAAWRDHCARSLKAYEDLYVSRLAQENQKYLKVIAFCISNKGYISNKLAFIRTELCLFRHFYFLCVRLINYIL